MSSRIPRVVVLASSPADLDLIHRHVPDDRYEVLGYVDTAAAAAKIAEVEVEVVIADEDHPSGSGLDWLFELRRTEPKVSMVLIAAPEHGLDLAVDALNRAYVRKILTKPYDPVELVEELDDAARSYSDDIFRERKLRLSTVKVRRLTRSYEEVYRDLVKERREVKRLTLVSEQVPQPVLISEMGPAANDGAPAGPPPRDEALETALGMGILELMGDMLVLTAEGSPQQAPGRLMARLVEHCGRELAWPDEEVREVALAAQIHHAFLPDHDDESQLGFGRARHARRLADRLDPLPGMQAVSAMVRHHHLAWSRRDHATQLPRGTWLLQLVSLFERWANDPALHKLTVHDPDAGLNRASCRLLAQAGRGVHPDLCDTFVKRILPEFFGREETCISMAELEPGQRLSRTIYAENLVLLAHDTTLDGHHIERIRAAADQIKSHEVWVRGSLGRTRRRLQRASTLPSDAGVEPVR